MMGCARDAGGPEYLNLWQNIFNDSFRARWPWY